MKKINFTLILFFAPIYIYSQSNAFLDEYWIEHTNLASEINTILSQVNSGNYEATKIKLFEITKKYATKMQIFAQSQYKNMLTQRYIYHMQNRTAIWLKIKSVSDTFQVQINRIRSLPGGEQFYTGMFNNPEAIKKLEQQTQ